MYVPYRSRAKPGFYSIDGERVRCDSKMEATIIQKLSSHGFKDKWRRTRGGIAFGTAKATPDVELCILHDGMNRRALVEFKAFSVDEYPRNKRRDLYAVRRFYRDAIPLLYINKSDKWYIIEPTGGTHLYTYADSWRYYYRPTSQTKVHDSDFQLLWQTILDAISYCYYAKNVRWPRIYCKKLLLFT